MKVIDLLNKLVNGEEVPEEITYEDNTYHLEFNNGSGKYYYVDDENNLLLKNINNVYELNEKIEIIEEDKKIEKVNTYVLCDNDFYYKEEHSLRVTKIIDKAFEEYSHKINEIIDKINEME